MPHPNFASSATAQNFFYPDTLYEIIKNSFALRANLIGTNLFFYQITNETMKKIFSIAIISISLILTFNFAFAGGGINFDAKIIKYKGEKVIFGEDDAILRYIHFCNSFLGKLYFGDILIQNNPQLDILHQNIPLYSNINFNGGITGGLGDEKNGYHYCLTNGMESEIKIIAEEYTIKEGDSPWKIIKNKGGNPFDYKLIAKFNNLSNPDTLKIDHTLILPNYKK